jgi:hypothetical protein
VKNEQKRRHNDNKSSTNTSASASPQACPTPLLESASILPTTSSHIPLVTRSGRQATQFAQF